MTKPIRKVLISAGGTGTAFALATRLRSTWPDGVFLVVADTNPEHLVTSTLLADRFYQTPAAAEVSFNEVLSNILREEGICTYVPLINEEIAKAAEMAAEFPDLDIWGTNLSGKLAIDKKFANSWLNSLSLPIPETYNAVDAQPNKNYFLKPINGFGSKEARKLSGAAICELATDGLKTLLIQEHCEQPEITVDSFFDSRTGFCRAIARERLEVKAGVCTKARVFEDSEFTGYAIKIGRALDQRGTICFQVMRSEAGFVITDLNLRPGAGTAISVACGVDVLSAAFACRWGESYTHFISDPLPKQGLYVTRQYTEFVMQENSGS
jgi:hypothetical protein